MAQTRPSPTLSRGFTRLGRFLAPYGVDNVFVERLWRSVKYEDVYLHAYETPASLRAGLTCYFQFYNGRRRHSALGRRTPDVVYFDATSFGTAA